MGLRYTQHPVNARGWTDWISAARLQKLACCDCGLVHKYRFRVRKGVICFKARRDTRATAQRRRSKQVCQPRRRSR